MSSLDSVIGADCPSTVPGIVAAVDDGHATEVAAVGIRTLDGDPMTRDTAFRIASVTKPIMAAGAMVQIERGTVGLDDPVVRWLPELEHARVLRDPHGPLDDTVPLARPITVRHLLESSSGLGQVSDFTAPIMEVLTERLNQGPPAPDQWPSPDEWAARLDGVPLVHQPGEGWSYNTSMDLLGLLLARACDRPLAEVMADDLFDPLGMVDTGFWANPGVAGRLGDELLVGDDGLEIVDRPDGAYTHPPAFESCAGGLVSTVDDLLRFGRMLCEGGLLGDARVLDPASVHAMTSVQVPPIPGNVFLSGSGWGYGAAVDVETVETWQTPGRYGWMGASGTALCTYPNGRVAVWLTQVRLQTPDDFAPLARFLEYVMR